MKTSEQLNFISEALAKFSADKPTISKDKSVKMKGTSRAGKEYDVNYDYAPLEVLQESVKPVLAVHGLFVTQMLGFDQGSTGIYTRIGHSSGQFIESFWPVSLDSVTKEQDRGSKLTYNKRYAYAAALDLILSDEDTDAVGVENEKPQSQPQASYTKQFYKQDILPNPADFMIDFGKKYKGKKIGDVPVEDLDQTIEYFLNSAKDSRSLLTGKVRQFVVNAHDYLVTKGYYPPYE